MSRKKIVITGASGFLGSHIVKRLKDGEIYSVYALSSRPDALKGSIGGSSVEYLNKDAFRSNGDMLQGAIVINCAYPRNSTGTAIADGLEYIQRVFEVAVDNEALAIINISSQSVYSQQRTEAASEETPVCLESSYAVGKYAVELMLESICRHSDTAYTNLRMASLIGPGFDQRIVNRLVKQALETGKLTVKRNKQRFGFFDVEDAVSGIVAMLGSDVQKWKQVYNLGGADAHSLIDIAQAVMHAVDKEIQLTIIDGEESCNTALDCSLHAGSFGFERQYSLASSVTRILNKALA